MDRLYVYAPSRSGQMSASAANWVVGLATRPGKQDKRSRMRACGAGCGPVGAHGAGGRAGRLTRALRGPAQGGDCGIAYVSRQYQMRPGAAAGPGKPTRKSPKPPAPTRPCSPRPAAWTPSRPGPGTSTQPAGARPHQSARPGTSWPPWSPRQPAPAAIGPRTRRYPQRRHYSRSAAAATPGGGPHGPPARNGTLSPEQASTPSSPVWVHLPMSELLLPLNPCGNSPSQKWQI